jgi:hypothetical protein
VFRSAGVKNPEDFVAVFSLRSCGELACDPNASAERDPCQLATELVYIHSKLMIVDDARVLCGSANINDRSLIGSRDSELAFVLEDSRLQVSSKMGGKNVMVGEFASSLRKHLFAEHLGQVLEDFLCLPKLSNILHLLSFFSFPRKCFIRGSNGNGSDKAQFSTDLGCRICLFFWGIQ